MRHVGWWVARDQMVLVTTAAVLSALGMSCAANRPERPAPDLAQVISAYRRGVADAARELHAGEPSIYGFGKYDAEGVDGETGLPYRSLAGDAVPPDLVWRVMGHNDTIRAYQGLPLGSPIPE